MVKEDRDASWAGERRNPGETSETMFPLACVCFVQAAWVHFLISVVHVYFFLPLTRDSHHLLSPALLTSFYGGSDLLLSMSF